MQKNQRKIGAFLTYISLFLRSALSIFFTPIILSYLGQSEFGLYQLVISVVAYLGLLSFGLNGSYIRYYSKFKAAEDEEGIARFNGMFFLIYFVIGTVTLGLGSLLVANVQHLFTDTLSSSEVALSKILMLILVISMSISFFVTVFSGYIYAHERYLFLNTLELLSIVSNPFLSIGALILGYGSIGLVSVSAGLNIFIQLIYIVYSFKKLHIKFIFKKFDFSFLKEIFIFSSFIFINIIVDRINWNVDKVLLGMYQGTVAIAIYSIASQLNTYYLTFSTSISTVFTPHVNQLAFQENSREKLNELFIRLGRIQFFIVSFILSGIIIFGKAFIILWIGKEYSQAYTITLILVIPVTIPLVQTIGTEIQRALNLHKFRALAYLSIAIINICISIPLTKMYSGVGSAIGTAIALLIGNGLIMNIYYHKKCGLNIIAFWKEIGRIVPSLVLPIISGYSILTYVHIHSWLTLLLAIALYSILYFISIWFLACNCYEKNLLLGMVKRLRQ